MSDPWYEVVDADAPLTQGDMIFDCPLLAWDTSDLPDRVSEVNATDLKRLIGGFREDVIVMTQACDLEHRKVEDVVLCPHMSLSSFREAWEQWMSGKQQNASEKAWRRTCEDIAAGYVWNQTLLNGCQQPELRMEIRVVDFHEVFTVPRAFLEMILRERNTPRQRLLPPYREHLSQAFARFFMRVGLPQPVNLS